MGTSFTLEEMIEITQTVSPSVGAGMAELMTRETGQGFDRVLIQLPGRAPGTHYRIEKHRGGAFHLLLCSPKEFRLIALGSLKQSLAPLRA